jgi:hypothetical protein
MNSFNTTMGVVMRQHVKAVVFGISIFAACLLASCGNDPDENGNNGEQPTAGDKTTYTADGEEIVMVHVSAGFTFPTGMWDTGTATITEAYRICQTEVTWGLWTNVLTWAQANGYNICDAGRRGNWLSNPVDESDQQPVTMLNWRSAMVWCNALTEWYNAHKGTGDPELVPVYYSDSSRTTLIKTSTDELFDFENGAAPGSQDDPYVKADATGFRLPLMKEWECAARYRGTNGGNGSIEMPAKSGLFWTPGNYASGSNVPVGDNSGTSAVAWWGVNSGAAGDDTQPFYTRPVKQKAPNALDLYDMSGNVWEYTFDLFNEQAESRARRGGSVFSDLSGPDAGWLLYCGTRLNSTMNINSSNDWGFRIAMHAP